MDNSFINAGIIAITYLLVKFAEMRLIQKENRPLKELIKDTAVVYFSILLGMYIIEQLIPVGNERRPVTQAFIDVPEF